MDLWFAEDKIRRVYSCEACLKNPLTAKERKCQEKGFLNLKKPRRIDGYSLEYNFCPGKATWFEEITELFDSCRIALETGILPKRGGFSEQDSIFCEIFPIFLSRWKDRTYGKIWGDVRDFTKIVLEGIFGKGRS